MLYSQSVSFTGNVYGYVEEKVLLLRKASKNVTFEGPISGAKILIKNSKGTITVLSDITGSYTFTLPEKDLYLITISRNGYSTVIFNLKYDDAGAKSNFVVTSFILKKDDNSTNEVGTILISNNGKISFSQNTTNQKKAEQDVLNSNKILIEKAISINNSSKKNIAKTATTIEKQQPATSTNNNTKQKTPEDSFHRVLKVSIEPTLSAIFADTLLTTNDLKQEIEKAKTSLALLKQSDKNYTILKNEITIAENQLKLKEQLIESQSNELIASKKKIVYLALLGLLAILSCLLILYFLRAKKVYAQELQLKNDSISKVNNKIMSSIRYAAVIQSNVLKDKNDLNVLFPNSFVFNQPKDIVTGDFCWFTEHKDHRIVAVADFTGHGVPGAMLTILGQSLLNKIIIDEGEISPSVILAKLNKAISDTFSENKLEYGVDITIFTIKNNSNSLTFAGISNGLFHYSENQLFHHKVTPAIIGKTITNESIKNQTIELKNNDCIYLMSDGFCDQLGIVYEKKTKYNIPKMLNLLAKISKEKQFITSGPHDLNDELVKWKGSNDQTDDVIVVGIKF